jgi:quercetin dioxygenase-like cupin family protein
MDEVQFLSGRVRKCSLPVAEPGQPGSPPLKRLLLKQGELAQFYDSDEGMRYLAIIELKDGAVRGNHYHLRKDELIYMISGQVLLRIEDPATQARESVELRAGDLAWICPGIAHALQTVHAGHAIEGSKARFEVEDVYRYSVG